MVLASIEAFSRGDVDEGLGYWADDCVFVNDAGAVGTAGTWPGPQGFKAWLRETTDAMSEYRLDVIDAKEEGDRVTVTFKEMGQGRTTGLAVERRIRAVFTLDSGKITRIQTST